MARGVKELEAAIKSWRQSTRPLRSRPFPKWRLSKLKCAHPSPGSLTLSVHALVQAFKLFNKGLKRMKIWP